MLHNILNTRIVGRHPSFITKKNIKKLVIARTTTIKEKMITVKKVKKTIDNIDLY